ncbi:YJL123C-like protein [Saccharomyces cerevisiae VL3]|nr:YJL123C-like protein [Saccharomyces cerevisiae VL3]
MSENKNSGAEDVFEFLDSLPEAKNGGKMVNTDVKGSQEGVKGGSNSVAGKTGNDGKKGDDDIFEFLEELEKSNLSLTDKKGVEKKAPSESVNNKAQGEKVEESKENKNYRAGCSRKGKGTTAAGERRRRGGRRRRRRRRRRGGGDPIA